jgi:hypothetical protein
MTGFPDIAAYAADEAGEDWVPNSSSATVNRWRISQTESRAKLAALVNFAYRGPKADSGGS